MKKKKILFFLVLLCTIVQGAWAEVINGLPAWDPTLENGNTYRVIRNWEYDWGRINVKGDVKLIVEEGYTVNFLEGIELSEGNTLTIEGEGTITINIRRDYKSGIGAKRMGTLIINGCTLNVKGGLFAAGIGGDMENTGGGRIVINGGVVNATGNQGAAAIGGGYKGVCGDIVINGGQVTAHCGDYGIGIGGGNDAPGSGSLTMGWTRPDDFVRTTGSFNFDCYKVKSISFAKDKQFVIEGTQTIANTGNIPNRKIVPYVVIPSLPGSGTASNPYTIGTADEWDRFAKSVAFGNNYNGQYVKLTADISASGKCGFVSGATPSRAFSGTFDGGGKTITAAIIDDENQGTALFCNINGAAIRNLTVAGTVNAKRRYTAGLVGFADGTNLIENCTVNATLGIESDYAAGFVGNGRASGTTLKNCVFTGIVNGTNGRRSHVGGIYGWTTDGTPSLLNCLEKGSYNNIASMHPMGLQNDRGTISQCYYLNAPFGNPANGCVVSGAYQVSTAPIEGEISRRQQLVDGNTYFVPCVVSGVDAYYELTGSGVSITPTVTGLDNAALTFGTDYTATLDGNAVAALPITVSTTGRYTLTITGKGDYTGTKNINFILSGTIEGDGSEANPYIISAPYLWSLLVEMVNNGIDFSGKFVKLNDDITVTEMVGTTSEKAFKGTFLGNGKTLTVAIGSASQSFGEDNCAPFRFVNGATIKDLNVRGDIYTSRKFAAGLVGRSYGATTITDCHVSTLIHSSINGDGTHGGLVAMPDGQLTIKDCIFDGRLLTTNGTTRCGGFVGWHNGKSISVTSSLYAPSATSLNDSPAETPITDGATFVRGASAGSYCYYTEPMGEAQGTQVFASLPAGELCMQAKAADGKMYYLPCSVSGIKPSYSLEDDVSITPAVTGLDNAALTLGTDYTAALNGNAVDQFPITITTEGDHVLTFTGKSDNYIGTKSITVFVTPALKGDGTAEKPYLIHSGKEWSLLATNVADGRNYSGQFVKLMADIDITLPVGVREDKPFSGTLLGDGHTLTADIRNNTEEQGAAPFRYIKDATIQNLTVAGTIASNSYHTAGIVGFAEGTNLIENCTVSATLNISSNYAGGIVGHGLTSNTTLRGCIFVGAVNGINGDFANVGGLWGWSDSGTPVLENCLEKGTYTAVVSMHPMGLQGNKGTITGCYYMNAQMGSPAKACTVRGAYQVATTNTGGEVYKPVTAIDGNTYYTACIVSNTATLYHYTGSDIKVDLPTVTATDGMVLTPGTDFTFSPETVREKGDYTLTISGRGIYSGTKSMPFSVTEDMFITSEMSILSSGEYIVFEDITVNDRITISGDVVLNLCKDTKLTIPKGIELSKGNTLTINGPGALSIEKVDDDNAGIGAVEVGTLVINGGTIKVFGGKYGAGLGGSRNNVSGGSITINGGLLNVLSSGFVFAAPIGGGYDDKPGQYGVCGDIVINGGQVMAQSFLSSNYGPGRQENDQIYSSGTLTLGWTNPDDFIYMGLNTTVESTHLNSLTFAEGKQFLLRNKTTIAAPGNMAAEYIVPLMALANIGNNSSQVDDYDGMKLPVALLDRTLYKDGEWNTLCLPFNIALQDSPLDGAVARPLTSASISGSTLNLTFGDAVTTLQAGTPYIIKWAKADNYVDDDAHNIVSPVFSGVTIDKTERSYDNGTSGDLRLRFLGTCASQSFDAEDKSILFMGDDDKLYYPQADASIGAQRAYFKIGEDGARANSRGITAFNIDFGDGETTGIREIHNAQGTMHNQNDIWYSLNGSRLNGKPSRAGVYINNGNMIVIK